MELDKPAKFSELQLATDRYLDQHFHTDEAYVVVDDVLRKWDFMVTLATQRALQELFYTNLPDNVIPLQRLPQSPDIA